MNGIQKYTNSRRELRKLLDEKQVKSRSDISIIGYENSSLGLDLRKSGNNISFFMRSILFLIVSFLFIVLWSIPQRTFAESLEPKAMLTYNETFIFNPRAHTWKAVSDGKIVRSGRASGGKGYCADTGRSCRTPTGTYHIISKRGADCKSSLYPVGRGGAKMPYCMFFSRYYAIHGYHDVPNYNASHGCIRVRSDDALWLHRHFIKIGTRVVVQPY